MIIKHDQECKQAQQVSLTLWTIPECTGNCLFRQWGLKERR